jgi:hypothetical protein
MARSTVLRLFVVLLCVAFVGVVVGMAAEGTVVSYEKGKLVVKVGDKNETITTGKGGAKLLDKDGKALGKTAADVLKAGTKVEVKKDGDKVVEVQVK